MIKHTLTVKRENNNISFTLIRLNKMIKKLLTNDKQKGQKGNDNN